MRGGIVREPPGLRTSKRRAERADERLDDNPILAHEHRIGDASELEEHRAELGVEAANIDKGRDARDAPVGVGDVDAVAVALAPGLNLGSVSGTAAVAPRRRVYSVGSTPPSRRGTISNSTCHSAIAFLDLLYTVK